MTLRTSSVRRQRQAWACLSLLGVIVYFVLVHAFGLGNPLLFFGAHQMRVLLPLVVVLRILAREFRWDGVVREEKVEVEGRKKSKCEVEGEEWNFETCAAKPLVGGQVLSGPSVDATSSSRQNKDAASSDGRDGDVASIKERSHHSSTSTLDFDSSPVHHRPQPSPSTSSLTGEVLFDQARALPHQMVPDFEIDGPYLDLLGKSAAAGYAPALAKLGEYAMRRAAWVEAYYWMSMAKRQGMQGLANVMREIRKNWSLEDFPDEAENVNPLFTVEAGSIGRALLHVDSGHEAANAREFLKATHPEFLARVS